MTLCKEHLEIINNSLPEEVAQELFKKLASCATNKYYEVLKRFIKEYDKNCPLENFLVKSLVHLISEWHAIIEKSNMESGTRRDLIKFMQDAHFNCYTDLKETLRDEA